MRSSQRDQQASVGQVAATLQQEVASTKQQVAEVKTAQAASDASIITLQAPPSGGTGILTMPNGKPAFATADGRFTGNIRAIIMFDAGKYFQKSNLPAVATARDLNGGTNFRRARFGVDGKLFKDFDYAIIYEFGGSGGEDAGHIQEIWAQYTALKPWKIRVGAFEPNIGLAAAVSTSQMPLMERPSAAEVARNVAAGDSRSAVQLTGNGIWGGGDAGIATRWFASAALTGNTVGTINSDGRLRRPAVGRADRHHRPFRARAVRFDQLAGPLRGQRPVCVPGHRQHRPGRRPEPALSGPAARPAGASPRRHAPRRHRLPSTRRRARHRAGRRKPA